MPYRLASMSWFDQAVEQVHLSGTVQCAAGRVAYLVRRPPPRIGCSLPHPLWPAVKSNVVLVTIMLSAQLCTLEDVLQTNLPQHLSGRGVPDSWPSHLACRGACAGVRQEASSQDAPRRA